MYGALIGIAANLLGGMMGSKGGGSSEKKSEKLNYNPGTYNSPRQTLHYPSGNAVQFAGASKHKSWRNAHRARHGIRNRY